MYQGAWKTDDKDEAIFIDVEETSLHNSDCKDEENYSDWDKLPDVILENIFSYLSMREKYWASMTCKNWYRAFYSPKTWSTFILDDYTLTRKKFNYYSGWQYVLDHYRTMQCLTNIGRHIRYLVFEPMMNFYNLYEFMNMLSYYAEEGGKNTYVAEGVGNMIKGLKFVFPCTMRQKAGAENLRIFGTGGQILASLKRLMSNLGNLKELELVDLMLDNNDARFLLDEVCNQCCLQLETLVLINTTKEAYPLLHPGVFLNLYVLVISPQNVGEDLIQLLGYTSVKHLHIKSNMFSPSDRTCENISPNFNFFLLKPAPQDKALSSSILTLQWNMELLFFPTLLLLNQNILTDIGTSLSSPKIATTPSTIVWQQCKRENPELAVHIECKDYVCWQYQAPVKSLIFNSAQEMINTDVTLTAVEYYGNYLEAFIHHGLPRFYRSKSFHDRADSTILLLCRQCPRLRTLVIRERISTATILLIVSTAKNLRHFIVRKNAVIIKTDWPKSNEWTDDFYYWLKVASRKYESVEKEVSQILGYRWTMLTDREFKKIHIRPYQTQLEFEYF